MSKNLDETVSIQSEKIKELIRERLHDTAEDKSSSAHLTSLSAASSSGRNEFLRTHCILIVKEKKENSFCQMCE